MVLRHHRKSDTKTAHPGSAIVRRYSGLVIGRHSQWPFSLCLHQKCGLSRFTSLTFYPTVGLLTVALMLYSVASVVVVVCNVMYCG